MTAQGDAAGTARCPYCGCGFVPEKPGQVYCGPWCEQQHKLEGGQADLGQS